MIKPSELTPATSDLLVSLIAQTFSEEEVAVITGDAFVGATFSALPFDHLFFTGSTAVGRAVMRAQCGAATLQPHSASRSSSGKWRSGSPPPPTAKSTVRVGCAARNNVT